MIKNFVCTNPYEILAAARYGKTVRAKIETVYYGSASEDVILPPQKSRDEIIREKLISYYGEPNQNFNTKKRVFR